MSEGFNIKSLIVPGLLLGTVGFIFMQSEGTAKADSGGGGAPPGGGGTPPVGTPPVGAPPGTKVMGKDANGYYPTNNGTPYATSGKQSNPLYQWTYVVVAGDSPILISKRITGIERSYLDLIAANPEKATVGDRLNPFSKIPQYNFASMNPGDKLKIPKAWNVFIDETGATNKPAGTPYPV